MIGWRTARVLGVAIASGALLAACYCPPGGEPPEPTAAALSVRVSTANGSTGSVNALGLLCQYVVEDPNDSSAMCSTTSHYSLYVTNTGDGPTTSAPTVTPTLTNGLDVVFGTPPCATAVLEAGATCEIVLNLFRPIADGTDPSPTGTATFDVTALGTSGEALSASVATPWDVAYPL